MNLLRQLRVRLALHRETGYRARMQTFRSAPVLLLFLLLSLNLHWGRAQTTLAPPKPPKLARSPSIHVVSFGAVRAVPYTPPDASAEERRDETSTLKVRPLVVDGRQREWVTGEIHEVTDRSFTVRRALRLNDALPSEHEPRWVWQPGPWLLIDRFSGRITALHLPDYDAAVSNPVWFRDYAAYCGIAQTAKGGLYAVVAQLGARRAVVQKQVGAWPQPNHFIPVCQPAQWERLPIRVTLKPTGAEAISFDIVGTTSLVEEGDAPEP